MEKSISSRFAVSVYSKLKGWLCAGSGNYFTVEVLNSSRRFSDADWPRLKASVPRTHSCPMALSSGE
jgi:hypothetical protein